MEAARVGTDDNVLPVQVHTPAVDVVITVYEALEHFQRCLASVLRCSGSATRVIVVNDGSSAHCTDWLRSAARSDRRVQLLENARNEGYTRAANRGLRASSAKHVVLLNSDTVVSRGWLEGLLRCADSAGNIGLVGPLSNAASWQSVPRVFAENGSFALNELSDDLGVDGFAELVQRASTKTYPRVPFVNGFCLLLKRAVIERVGLFDEVSFPEGYGEENDYCIRARDAGFELAIADDTYVYHAKSRSFGTVRRAELSARANKALKLKHGPDRVALDMTTARDSAELARIRAGVAAALRDRRDSRVIDPKSLRVLFLLPGRGNGGGTHSVLLEAAAMRRLGVAARVAVRAADREWYLRGYEECPDIAELLLPFTPETLPHEGGAFDVVVATTASSVDLLLAIRRAKPRVLAAYYVQDYEPLFYEEGSERWRDARASYERAGDAVFFAKTDWIVRQLSERHALVVQRVLASIDHSTFHSAARAPRSSSADNAPVRVAAMVRPQTPRRNATLTMQVLGQLVAGNPQRVEIHIFGCHASRVEFRGLPQDFSFVNYGELTRAEVATLLQRCDVFVDLSSYQAFGRTALEAMACGCAVVVPRAGGTDEYAEHEVNAIVVDTSDVGSCLDGVGALVRDGAKRQRLAAAGLATAGRYSVEAAAVSELNVLAAGLAQQRGSPVQLLGDEAVQRQPTCQTAVLAPATPGSIQERAFPVARRAMAAIRGNLRQLASRSREAPGPRPLLNPANHMSDNKLLRKMKKLVHNPDAFFADSPSPAVQKLGALWKRGAQEENGSTARSPDSEPSGPTQPINASKAQPATKKSHATKTGANLQRASREARGGNVRSALQLYSEAVAAFPDDVDALAGEAACRFHLAQYNVAAELFDRLALAQPGTGSFKRSAELCRSALAEQKGSPPALGRLVAALEPITHRAVKGWVVDQHGKSSVNVVLYVDDREVGRQEVQLGGAARAHGLSFVDFVFALPAEVCDGIEHRISIVIENQRHHVFGNLQRRTLHELKLGEFTMSHGYARGVLFPQAFPAQFGKPATQARVNVVMDGELVRSLTVKFSWENGVPRPAFFTQKLPRTASDGNRHELRVFVPDLATELRTPSGAQLVTFQEHICGQVEAIKDGVLAGWAFDVRDPAKSLEVSLFDGDSLMERKITSGSRSDVNKAFGIEGTHGFAFHLPAEVFDGRHHHLRVYVRSVRLPSALDDQPVMVTRDELVESKGRFQGKVEGLSAERVSGWAADLSAPYRPVHVSIKVDGVVVATAIANQFRARLQDAGKGSGNHWFDVPLPSRLMNGKKAKVEVMIAESGGKAVIGGGTVHFSLVDFFGNRPRSLTKRRAAFASRSQLRPGQTPIISFIVLNLDGEHLLPGLLGSIDRVAWSVPFEIILIDHGSSDESLTIAREYADRLPLRIVDRQANYSFSESNNFAARMAQGEYLAFVNNDIVFLDDCLSPACAHFADPSIGMVGVRLVEPLLSADGSSVLAPHHIGVKVAPSLAAGAAHGRIYLPVEAALDDALPPGCHDVPAVTAALSVCRKRDYCAVEGFDEGYCYGMEDVDLCHKLTYQLGKRIVCDTRLSAIHQRSATRNRPKPVAESAGVRPGAVQNRERYVRRFGRKLTRQILSSLVQGSTFFRATPLQVTFAVTEANINTTAGDFFTALELGEALRQECDYRVMFAPMGNHELPGTDVLVAMRHDYDIRQVTAANPGLVTVAWIRNRVDQWLATGQLDAYHVLLCSSQAAIDDVRAHTGREATLFPIATNPDRFRPLPSESHYAADVTFTGHFWGANRDGLELLNPGRISGTLAIFGKEWGQCPAWHAYWRGQVPYTDLPSVYASTSIVIDDSHPVTRKWGSLNSRVFDALGSGKLVLTNCRDGARALFGDRLPTFDSSEELEALINHYLSAPADREALAQQLHREVLSAHTYSHRARTFKSTLESMLKRSLRFALKVPIPKPENKERWGDYHFALGIQRALEARGHLARIDLIPDWNSGLSVGDDVVIVLRGLTAYQPSPRALNLMWLISHPTDVPYSEYEKFDHVFVASESFAHTLADNVSVPVSSLLQCTDPTLFSPRPAPDGVSVPELLFVGNSRGQQRRIVRDSVEANLDLGVFGAMWEQFLPRRMWHGTHVSNRELAAYYSTAKVVLNDHWPDMARHGFISNRIFDAGACNATIITDAVAGLQDVFGNLVSTYTDSNDLKRQVTEFTGDDAGRYARGERLGDIIRREHTFMHRVDEILRVAEQLLSHTRIQVTSNGAAHLNGETLEPMQSHALEGAL